MFPFKTALNASTLFPFNLDLPQQVHVAAEAGYEGFELWVKDIDAYLAAGGTLSKLRAALADTGIPIVNAIAFFKWADADPATREEGFAQAEREMQMLAELGCQAVAAPPFGDVDGITLEEMAAQFARLAELGRSVGVEPYLEFWGRAKKLSRLSQALFLAVESGVSNVKLLLDPFHMYTGGSSVDALRYLHGSNIGICHVNDYPAEPGRGQIADSDRVMPGQGVAPSHELASLLYASGYRGYLSLELFIGDFGNASALGVAKHGLEMVRATYQVEDGDDL
jgi:2-keto-myo-inositol isomerase